MVVYVACLFLIRAVRVDELRALIQITAHNYVFHSAHRDSALFGFIALRDRALALAILQRLSQPTFAFHHFWNPSHTEMMIVAVCLWLVRDHGWKEIEGRAWMIAAGLIMTSAISRVVPQIRSPSVSGKSLCRTNPCLFHDPSSVQRSVIVNVSLLIRFNLFVAIIGIAQWITDGIPTPWDIERRITSVFLPQRRWPFSRSRHRHSDGNAIHARHTWRTTIF